MNNLRILLADDHKMVREGLRTLLDSQTGMHVIGEAASGKEALEKAEELTPDVVVMDLSMPGLNGLQATELLTASHPAIKVVVLTAYDDEDYLARLCKAGAVGFVLKRSAVETLVKAIRIAAQGEMYFEPSVASKALARLTISPAAGRETTRAELSDREEDVLKLLAWGNSSKEAADQMNLSVKTVETYRARIGQKLGLRSRTQIVKYALRQGWLSDSDPAGPLA
ncbi:MAG: response regulator [Limisphaerales bacterium]